MPAGWGHVTTSPASAVFPSFFSSPVGPCRGEPLRPRPPPRAYGMGESSGVMPEPCMESLRRAEPRPKKRSGVFSVPFPPSSTCFFHKKRRPLRGSTKGRGHARRFSGRTALSPAAVSMARRPVGGRDVAVAQRPATRRFSGVFSTLRPLASRPDAIRSLRGRPQKGG